MHGIPAAARSEQDRRAIFSRRESEVRGYCRSFPAVFSRALGATVWDETGRSWIDFLAGAGTLNYGHNEPAIKQALIAYLQGDGILHALDMHTVAKREFLEAFERSILMPRGLDYKVQFTGPTGTNAIEAAFKLARKATKRTTILAFTNGFHGMTLGALAATGNAVIRAGAGVPLICTSFAPYDGWLGPDIDTVGVIAKQWQDASSGADLPAACVVECVQGEGGLNAASFGWLRRLAELCARHQVLLIIDDIQAGCGRTGPFFSFEPAGIVPDIVTVSKAIGGIGMPMSLVLIRRDLDLWKPGEHTGTFRGNSLAFVAARAAIDIYWSDDALSRRVADCAQLVHDRLAAIAKRHPHGCFTLRGRGLYQGLHCQDPQLAARISAHAFDDGLIIERAGPEDEVVKVMPPLTISDGELAHGLAILERAVARALSG
jgi:diaminobutyrate-2-oxoglutarate transaminase